MRTQEQRTIAETIAAHARRAPAEPAMTFLRHGDTTLGQTVTWLEVHERSRAVAGLLGTRGPAGSRAIVAAPAGVDYALGLFGCLYAGWIPVPAPAPASPRRDYRLDAIASDAGAAAVLTTVEGMDTALRAAPDLPWLPIDGAAASPSDGVLPAVDEDAPVFLQYTSGSTGQPKGVVVTHRTLAGQLEAAMASTGIEPGEAVVQWLPFYHDFGLVGHLLLAAHAGAHLVIMQPAAFLRRPAAWLEAITRYGAVYSGGPNFALDLCTRRVTDADLASLDLSTLRTLGCGGEPIRGDTVLRFHRRFASCGLGDDVVTPAYGMAESVLMLTSFPVTKRVATPELVRTVSARGLQEGVVRQAEAVEAAQEVVSCGFPACGVEMQIVDPETLEPCAPNTIGEIWARGSTVAAGYWQRDAETAATFRACTAAGTGPWLRTGDLGALHHGTLVVTGRRKEVIIVRGHNHYPGDIERTAQLADPALEPGSGAAFSVPAGPEEQVVLVQEVARSARRSVDPAAVCARVRRAVGEVHGIALHSVVLVKPLSVPKTSSGKVQRLRCAGDWQSGALSVIAIAGTPSEGLRVESAA